jgi:MFS family permease
MSIQNVAQGWLVYQITGSALALGWVASVRSISQLALSLYGGVLSDRFDKRQLLLYGRLAQAINLLALALLVTTGAIRVWHLLISSAVSGLMSAFTMPAYKSYMAELVDRKTLLNAISLDSVGMGLTGIMGASLSGVFVDRWGVASAYWLMGALYLPAVYALTRTPPGARHEGQVNSVLGDMWEGIRYLRASPVLPYVLGLAFVRMGLGMSYSALLSKYVEEVLGLGATGLGMLSAAPGVGRLVSGMTLASLGARGGQGKILLSAGLLMAGALVAFVNVRSFYLVLFFLALVGAGHTACMVTNNALMQDHSDPLFRGRVSSMRQMMLGLGRLLTIPSGAAADSVGVPIVVSIQGLLFALIFAGVGLLKPSIRKLR